MGIVHSNVFLRPVPSKHCAGQMDKVDREAAIFLPETDRWGRRWAVWGVGAGLGRLAVATPGREQGSDGGAGDVVTPGYERQVGA